jgi:hypothetical protein
METAHRPPKLSSTIDFGEGDGNRPILPHVPQSVKDTPRHGKQSCRPPSADVAGQRSGDRLSPPTGTEAGR